MREPRPRARRITRRSPVPRAVCERLLVAVAEIGPKKAPSPCVLCGWDLSDPERVASTRTELEKYLSSSTPWQLVEVYPGNAAEAEEWIRRIIDRWYPDEN